MKLKSNNVEKVLNIRIDFSPEPQNHILVDKLCSLLFLRKYSNLIKSFKVLVLISLIQIEYLRNLFQFISYFKAHLTV